MHEPRPSGIAVPAEVDPVIARGKRPAAAPRYARALTGPLDGLYCQDKRP
jgi:hypothetical protein